jgi:hypothetical protein
MDTGRSLMGVLLLNSGRTEFQPDVVLHMEVKVPGKLPTFAGSSNKRALDLGRPRVAGR